VAKAEGAADGIGMTPPSELAPLLAARTHPLSYDSEVEFALLDAQGVIVAVNDAWLAHSAENGGPFARTGVGTSYLEVCDGARDAGSIEVGSSIRRALAGQLPTPVVVTIPCDAPRVPSLVDVSVSSRLDDQGSPVGAIVSLSRLEDPARTAATTDIGSVQPADRAATEPAGHALDLRARIDERERIAAHLNNAVMSGLFSIGIGLQGMLDRLVRPEDKTRLAHYVAELDAIVHDLRTTVFDLVSVRPDRTGLKRRLLEVVDESTQHSLSTDVQFSGPLDSEVGGDAADIIVEVVREALSNVLHGTASTVNVSVALSGSLIAVQVSDDATPYSGASPGTGLRRLERYAEEAGGDLQITKRAEGGTLLRWTALLERDRQLATAFARARERPSA
jgi:signal transduction histidine kinase